MIKPIGQPIKSQGKKKPGRPKSLKEETPTETTLWENPSLRSEDFIGEQLCVAYVSRRNKWHWWWL